MCGLVFCLAGWLASYTTLPCSAASRGMSGVWKMSGVWDGGASMGGMYAYGVQGVAWPNPTRPPASPSVRSRAAD
jgi:hypothetical protein